MRLHRSSWLLALPALLVAGAAARPASAQAVSWQMQLRAGIEATDNVQFVAYNTPDDAEKPRAGFIAQLNPSVLVSYETPRWLHELNYALNLAATLGIGAQYNYQNRLELRSRYEVSELTQVNFAVRANQGALTFFPEPEPGQPAAAFAPGTFNFMGIEVAQAAQRRMSEMLTLNQNAQVNYFRPIDADPPRPATWAANVALGLAYADDPDAYNVNLGSQIAATEEIECTDDQQCGAGRVCAVATRRCEIRSDAAGPLQDEIRAQANAPILANRLAAGYRHDFKNGLVFEGDVGVQQAMRATDGGAQNWQPVGRLGLRYTQDEVNFGVAVNHGTQLNLNVGGLVMATNGEIQSGFAIDRQTRYFTVQIMTAYQRGTPFDAFGALLPGFHVGALDAGLTFRPENWLPNFNAVIRYQFRLQITEAQPGLAVLEDLVATRHGFALNVGFDWPERQQAPAGP